MRLERFSVSNYRSITAAHRVPVADSTILIGKNNEGKSNTLAALTTALRVVDQLGDRPLLRGGQIRLSYRTRELYDWERDFPIQLQESNPDGESVFRLEFSLTKDEREDFRKEVKSSLNENLPIEIRIGRGNPKFKVLKPGRGAAPLNNKATQIASFIGRRVEFTYIPAVRTAEAAMDVVRSMVSREFAKLEQRPDYVRAMEALAKLQQPVLTEISQRIEVALREFVPRIKKADVRVSEDARFRAMRRSVQIFIDDGTHTSLEAKGDGVQSLAAIGLLRGLTPSSRHTILALEEPESHLHPGAIHRLRDVIFDLAGDHQVVLTTHCPLFVDRVHLKTNIIVSENRARPAESINEIRELLGVRASDNLRHATNILLVEGGCDAAVLRVLVAAQSSFLATLIKSGTLVIEPLYGASKLSNRVAELQAILCNVHAYLDHDEEGRRAGEAAHSHLLLKPADLHYVTCKGMPESELEDMFRPDVYASRLLLDFGVDVQTDRSFRSNEKWSARMKRVFLNQGKAWLSKSAEQVKTIVAEEVAAAAENPLIDQKRNSFDALVTALERKLRGNTLPREAGS